MKERSKSPRDEKEPFWGFPEATKVYSNSILMIETMQGLVTATENFMDSYRVVVSTLAFRLNLG